MPYYQRSWNVLLPFGKAPPVAKNQRMVPSTEYEESKASELNVNELKAYEEQKPSKEMTITLDDVQKAQEHLKTQVEELQSTKCTDPVKDLTNFGNYKIKKDKKLFRGLHSSIYPASHPDVVNMPLMVRIFKPTALIKPENDQFLKILRRLGKSSQFIIATLDIFADVHQNIYLVQEYSSQGNVQDYLRKNPVSEDTMWGWAHSLYGAMDHLGSCGIAHRSIRPKHLMLSAAGPEGKDLHIKLSSFRDAIVYWNPTTNDIINQPCKPMSALCSSYFTAPECFGSENEVYDPVAADIWSFGATLYFVVSRDYPFNTKPSGDMIDAQIRNSLAGCTALGDSAKYCLYATMRSDIRLRAEFSDIALDIWFNLGSKADIQEAATTN